MGMNPTTWWGAPCHVSDKIYTTKDEYSIFVTRHRCRAALGHDSFIFSLTSPQNPPPLARRKFTVQIDARVLGGRSNMRMHVFQRNSARSYTPATVSPTEQYIRALATSAPVFVTHADDQETIRAFRAIKAETRGLLRWQNKTYDEASVRRVLATKYQQLWERALAILNQRAIEEVRSLLKVDADRV